MFLPELRAWNAEVVGVSSDPFDRQCEFAASLELSFALIADPDGTIAKRYRARRPLISFDRRITYVIDPDGRIAAGFHFERSAERHESGVRAFFEERLGPAPTGTDPPAGD